MLNNRRISSGLSLIELMLSLAITSIVMAAFVLFSKTYSSTASDLSQDIRVQLQIRSFVERLSYYASHAGYSPLDSSLPGIKDSNPIFISPLSGTKESVTSLRFVYDFDKNNREIALYGVEADVRKGRTEKRVILTRLKNNAAWMTDQVVLEGVKEFKCASRTVLGGTRAFECFLSVYRDFAPDNETLDYEVTIGTNQTY
jgi:hypothetical protein